MKIEVQWSNWWSFWLTIIGLKAIIGLIIYLCFWG